MFSCKKCENSYKIIKKESIKTDDKRDDEKKSNDQDNFFVFWCEYCGFSENIAEGTKLSGGQKKNKNEYVNKYIIHSKILPRTRYYVCDKKSCISHSDNSKREAMFYKNEKTNKVTYICLACNTIIKN